MFNCECVTLRSALCVTGRPGAAGARRAGRAAGRTAAPRDARAGSDPGAIIWWGTRYEAPHSAFNSRVSTLTLHTVEQRHASCGQTCESTVVLAGRGGGAGTSNFEARGTLGHVARAWRLASLACLARVCRRAVRRARCRPPGRGHSGKNHSDRPGAPSAGRVRAGRRNPGRERLFFPCGAIAFRSVRQFLNSHEHQHDTPQGTSACTLRPPGDTSSRAFLFASCRAISACRSSSRGVTEGLVR